MKNILKKFVLALTFVVGVISIPGFADEVEAKEAIQKQNNLVNIYPRINHDKVLTLDIGGREGNIVALWDRTWSGDTYVPQQNWKVEYDYTKGNNVVLIRNLHNNSVLTWDYYGTRSIIGQPQNYSSRQYWIVEHVGEDFILRSYYNPNYALTVPAAPHYNGKGLTVYPYRGDSYQVFSSHEI